MNNFFGSKLNSVLLLVLIILMVVAIKIMLKNPDVDYSPLVKDKAEDKAPVAEIQGNKSDLVSFSILPGSKVSGVVAYSGAIKGGYFFEANMLVNVLDKNKVVIKQGNTTATTDWMTADAVSFGGSIDFTNLPKGPAFVELHNDNASGLPENDKSVLIPIVIE
jgi:hypothetical protein